ncbi:MAG: ABC transporter ATP-binding protein [candidate division NC10 bacterium]|nr:ABC transporter ATP-binding protein [candidate division NC10 bacterium]
MIRLERVSKWYGSLQAVRELSLQVAKGEVFGFLGPNGAGKTTTIHMMTTLTRPTSGSIFIGGYDLNRQPTQAKMTFGVVPQHPNLEKSLTVYQNLDLHGRLYRLPKERRKKRVQEVLEYVGLWGERDVHVRHLSGGMERRLLIARGILHQPLILFLDEPTVGLDPQTRRRLWDMIRLMQEEGVTIFLTTHYIEEAEMLCNRVGIIHQGQMIALGHPEDLKAEKGRFALEYRRNGQTEWRFYPDRGSALAEMGSYADEVRLRETNLEDVFISMTGTTMGD